ncbi:MAG: glycosyltransferase [Clostridium sp.]|uniref:glycosyltransferase n=1 Tax=Clostridium TaxID=1485 RepID=UPI000DD0B0A1|nr:MULTISPECIES: glycosyltransferase [Clostridium]MDU5741499.1 glycosyltransferase [Clostridium sp.]MDU5785953.1 glycosyltransferase [Clostridium sp.]
MNSEIKLSIIVPVYNVVRYIDECLNSIIKSYKSGIEVILVDDGSNDGSENKCDFYADKYEYIKVIHQENGGLSVARNVGIENSIGKYIWFVDSDDYISETSINDIYIAIDKNNDLIIGEYESFYPDGKRIMPEVAKSKSDRDILPYEYFMKLGSVSYAAVKFIVKREIIIRNKLWFEKRIYHEDEDWTPRVLCHTSNFILLDRMIYHYRLGNVNSIMGMLNPKKVYDKLKVSKRLYEYGDLNKLSAEKKDFLKFRAEYMYIAALNEYSLYSAEERKKMKMEFQKYRYIIKNNRKKSKLVLNTMNLLGIFYTSKLLRARNSIK